MQVLNLVREFELQRMKESETIKEYSDKLLKLANRIRLLGFAFNDSRIFEKILVTAPERFEATITTLENTKDLSKTTLAELLSALQAQEKQHVMRQGGAIEGDFKGNNPPCKDCGKIGHTPFKCWKRPDAKCIKCNHLGHEAIICKNKTQQKDAEARFVDDQEEYQLFVASCLASSVSSESWLIDSGCTNHMTCDKDLFKYLSPTKVTKVRIGHGGYIPAKGMGTITIETQSGTKTISDVLYEASRKYLFNVKMRGRSFSLNLLEEERGFHQSRVELPLLKKDIPPDDEGCLCPSCDCKVDCIDLLNNLQGKDLSITDSWEKVYPKDAVATSGEKLDNI
ncbi:uncharacterized protein LOC107871627 [Capsicum annuum]|uniref:uncharacterized protein LOC107871627 n=1 Tax=Capsicum annuum TaxID=4072 RepID=UPI001FB05A87|nr:uncharacterized protein LOC107871627 [Capsicum annuum]